MSDNPVNFPRRFFPAQIAPQRDVGPGLDLTLRLKPESKAVKTGCDPTVSWVGADSCVRSQVPPRYLTEEGDVIDWDSSPAQQIQTLVMEFQAAPNNEVVDLYNTFAAVSGGCGEVVWAMTPEASAGILLIPMGPAARVSVDNYAVQDQTTVTLTATVDGVDLPPLTLLLRPNAY